MSILRNEAPREAAERNLPEPTSTAIAAARLKLVTNRRLGRENPAWLERLAQATPPDRKS